MARTKRWSEYVDEITVRCNRSQVTVSMPDSIFVTAVSRQVDSSGHRHGALSLSLDADDINALRITLSDLLASQVATSAEA